MQRLVSIEFAFRQCFSILRSSSNLDFLFPNLESLFLFGSMKPLSDDMFKALPRQLKRLSLNVSSIHSAETRLSM